MSSSEIASNFTGYFLAKVITPCLVSHIPEKKLHCADILWTLEVVPSETSVNFSIKTLHRYKIHIKMVHLLWKIQVSLNDYIECIIHFACFRLRLTSLIRCLRKTTLFSVKPFIFRSLCSDPNHTAHDLFLRQYVLSYSLFVVMAFRELKF